MDNSGQERTQDVGCNRRSLDLQLPDLSGGDKARRSSNLPTQLPRALRALARVAVGHRGRASPTGRASSTAPARPWSARSRREAAGVALPAGVQPPAVQRAAVHRRGGDHDRDRGRDGAQHPFGGQDVVAMAQPVHLRPGITHARPGGKVEHRVRAAQGVTDTPVRVGTQQVCDHAGSGAGGRAGATVNRDDPLAPRREQLDQMRPDEHGSAGDDSRHDAFPAFRVTSTRALPADLGASNSIREACRASAGRTASVPVPGRALDIRQGSRHHPEPDLGLPKYGSGRVGR